VNENLLTLEKTQGLEIMAGTINSGTRGVVSERMLLLYDGTFLLFLLYLLACHCF
jgi:hypothetical protein